MAGSMSFMFMICFTVLVLDLDMAFSGLINSPLSLLFGDPVEVPASQGLCKASVIPQGYPCQEFHVTTKDGFILGLQRIPQGRSGSDIGRKRPPVLVQHGVLSDGMSWLFGSPQESLLLVLADSGFDVWVANTRGTRFSSGHTSLAPYQREYWDWSWDEVVEYDMPALSDFVYQQTGQKLHYVGHSMGTLTAMVALSEGKMVDKLLSASMLSPIAYLSYMAMGSGKIAADTFVGEISALVGMRMFDIGPVLKAAKFARQRGPFYLLTKFIADRTGVDVTHIAKILVGTNCCLNVTAYKSYLANGLQPTSMKNMVHFAQTFRSGVVAKFDYGVMNMQHYGQKEAPLYNLANIPRDLPLFMSYGGQDRFADINDVKRLLNVLSSHEPDKMITANFVEKYAHMDFFLGYNAKEMIFNPLIDFLRLHTTQ